MATTCPASLIGGLTGSILLLTLPSKVFTKVVIVLILIALTLVVVQPRLSRFLAARGHAQSHVTPLLMVLVAGAGIYGGYFGAAQGIILIALLGIFLADDIQRLNAVKNALAMSVNLVASATFIIATDVDWAMTIGTAGYTAALSVAAGSLPGLRTGTKPAPRA